MESTALYKDSIAIEQSLVWHPFTQEKTSFTPIPIKKAEGCYLFSETGERYLDAISSWYVNLHGHSHPYIAEKIAAQASTLEHVIFADFTHEPAINLAKKLLPLLPGKMEKIFYSDNGSTSVEAALKIALQHWHNLKTPKSTIVCFKGSYHGDTFGSMSVAGKNPLNKPFWKHLFPVETITPPTSGNEQQSVNELKRVLEKHQVACFIFEPLILGVGGMVLYSKETLNTLIQLCMQYQVLTIADEVMTGFGRLGSLFACDQIDSSPDIICLSKGLTGGFLPLGATACTKDVYNSFYSDHLENAFLHGHSYCGNPIACTSALASLELLQKESCNLNRKMIEISHQEFCKRWKNHPQLSRCEFIGTILILEIKEQGQSYFNQKKRRIKEYFLSKGILIRPIRNVLYLMPPYCIKEEELQYIYHHLIQFLNEET